MNWMQKRYKITTEGMYTQRDSEADAIAMAKEFVENGMEWAKVTDLEDNGRVTFEVTADEMWS